MFVLQGLVVPVLRNVGDMSYADIEKGIAALGQKAKNNELAMEDMDGGTFTIRFGSSIILHKWKTYNSFYSAMVECLVPCLEPQSSTLPNLPSLECTEYSRDPW